MIGRRFGWGTVALVICAALSGSVRGQALGDNIRTSSNVAPFLPQVQGFVTEQAGKLGGSDPIGQRAAREALVASVAPPAGGGQVSAAFLSAFAGLVNDELMKLASNPDTRVRLNVAIVAAKVAEGAKNTKLQPLVQAMLKDPSDAVVWWTLRAARAILPYVLANPGGASDPMLATIIQIGQTRPGVIQTVYEALAIDRDMMPASATKGIWGALIPAIHTILQSRIDQFKTGMPLDAPAEIRAALYLTARNEYQDGQTLTQKVATVQKLSDLIGMSGQRAPDLNNEQRQDLAIMLRGVGGALHVVGQWENNSSAIQNVARPVSQLPKNASVQNIQDATRPVYNGLITEPKFARLTPPPKVGAMVNNGAAEAGGAPPATQSTASNGTK